MLEHLLKHEDAKILISNPNIAEAKAQAVEGHNWQFRKAFLQARFVTSNDDGKNIHFCVNDNDLVHDYFNNSLTQLKNQESKESNQKKKWKKCVKSSKWVQSECVGVFYCEKESNVFM